MITADLTAFTLIDVAEICQSIRWLEAWAGAMNSPVWRGQWALAGLAGVGLDDPGFGGAGIAAMGLAGWRDLTEAVVVGLDLAGGSAAARAAASFLRRWRSLPIKERNVQLQNGMMMKMNGLTPTTSAVSRGEIKRVRLR